MIEINIGDTWLVSILENSTLAEAVIEFITPNSVGLKVSLDGYEEIIYLKRSVVDFIDKMPIKNKYDYENLLE